MKFFVKILSLFLLAAIVSCSQKAAPVTNRGKNFYKKTNQYSPKKPIKEAKLKSDKNQVEALEGDTLFSIAKKNNVPLRDLIKQNNLSAPYNLKSGERVNLPPASHHEVQANDTLYSIAKKYSMSVENLVTINQLKAPYAVKVGQKIRIIKPEVEEKSVAEAVNTKQAVVDRLSKKDSQEQKPAENSVAPKSAIDKAIDKLNHFSWPIYGEISSRFGPKKGGLYNDGINIKAKEGAPVKAAEDGVVAYVGNELKGYGNLIIIRHSGGWITAYAHLSKTNVVRGQKVKKSAKIAEVGSSGNVTSPQLYFGLRKGRDAVNPENYLKRNSKR